MESYTIYKIQDKKTIQIMYVQYMCLKLYIFTSVEWRRFFLFHFVFL